ncbi:hypothetical protein AY606_06530 [Acinetobacter sp. SFB]|uniref:hypothetical protein n=1 Tax=Acinetobacter sp. SFB TaxID=1805634 RepID=UPI0007D80DE1|nr:hypothetical protein [Acinetobacter sp. SFB]OAL79082.1 hypothetical protein AY606_06530 [Acinetobacter sp. SFB]
MYKILKLKTIALFFAMLSLVSSSTFAESVAQFENNIINKYYKTSLTDRYENDGVNQEVATKVANFIERNSQSFEYPFKNLLDKNLLLLNYSPDRKLKFYTFNISAGGSMREFESYVQFKQGNKFITQALNDTGFIKAIRQTQLNNVPTYLVSRTYIGSSCEGQYGIQANQINNNQYKSVKVFKTKTKALDQININYDCHYYLKNIQPFDMDGHYIRISQNLKNIDILLIKPSGELTKNYLRYQKTKNNYQYIGTVK